MSAEYDEEEDDAPKPKRQRRKKGPFEVWWDEYGSFLGWVVFLLVLAVLGKACDWVEKWNP